jgi:hypothetical protein
MIIKGNNSNAGDGSKTEEDFSTPPPDGDASADPKNDDMQLDGKEKLTEVIASMQVGKFACPFISPMNSIKYSMDG